MKISSWLSGALDPVKLATGLGMRPDRWQAKVLRSTSPRLHLNCSRQVGKSTVTSLVALHQALYVPNSTVLIVSPTDRQSGELFLKLQGFYRALGKPIEPQAENVHSLRLENGSRILSLPASESGIRGFTASLILVDEASRVPDELYESVSPMLAVSGGRLIAMSTPAGRRGWWYGASIMGNWERIEIPATDCPRISKEFLEEERERLGEQVFAQEYECRFVDASGAAFTGDDISAMFGGQGPARPMPRGDLPSQRIDRGAVALERTMRAIEASKGRGDREDARAIARCRTHRWRQIADGSARCVFCPAERAA